MSRLIAAHPSLHDIGTSSCSANTHDSTAADRLPPSPCGFGGHAEATADRLKAVHQRPRNGLFPRWCTGFSRSANQLDGHHANYWPHPRRPTRGSGAHGRCYPRSYRRVPRSGPCEAPGASPCRSATRLPQLLDSALVTAPCVMDPPMTPTVMGSPRRAFANTRASREPSPVETSARSSSVTSGLSRVFVTLPFCLGR
jgi:hypothetical protein